MQLRDNYKLTGISNGCATASLTTQVDEGNGSLIGITIGSPSGATIVITDGSSGASSTGNIGTLQKGAAANTYWFLGAYAQGLKIVMGSPGEITAIWSPNT